MSDTRPQAARVERDWKVICQDIGVRLAGTEGEERAARYILDEFEKAGCVNCHMEAFPCRSRRKTEVSVEVDLGNGWQEGESAAVTGSSSTGGASRTSYSVRTAASCPDAAIAT